MANSWGNTLRLEIQFNTNHIIKKNSAPQENQRGYDAPVVPSCPSTATQTTHCDFAILQGTACLQLDTALEKCQCASLAMKTREDAFYPLQCHSGQLGSDWDKPEINPNLSHSRSHSLELLQDNSGPRFSSLDPLEIVLMGWNISEEEEKKQPTAISLANQQIFFLTIHQCVDAWWFMSPLIFFSPITYNCESSH